MTHSKITVSEAFNQVSDLKEDFEKVYNSIEDKSGMVKGWKEFILAHLNAANENGGDLEDLEFNVLGDIRALEEKVVKKTGE